MASESPRPTIRPARPDDAARCGEIAFHAWQRVWASWCRLMGDELLEQHYPDAAEDKRREVEAQIRERPQHAIVTELDGTVVGFLTFRPYPQRKLAEIGNNAVDPDYQGRGIGAAQCREALRLFRELGLTSATVWTGLDEGHAPARAMYENAGFKVSTPHVRYFVKL